MKKFFTLVAIALLACSTAFSQGPWYIGSPTATDVTATLTPDGTLTISGVGAMQSWDYPSAVPWNWNITSVVINNGVTSIGSYAFYARSSLPSVTIPESVTSIGRSAFQNCSGLTSVTIPESVTSIGNEAFDNCSKLTAISVNAGNTVYSSEDGVVFNKDKTTLVLYPAGKTGSYTIPEGVTSIGGGAFASCSGLSSVTIPESVISIAYNAFFQCNNLTAISVNTSNTVYSSEDGVVFNKDKTTLVLYPAGKTGSYTIPEGVTSIESAAFWVCGGLTSVTIPEGVTNIGRNAFYACRGLTSIIISEGVKSIGGSAFYGCSGLTSVTIPESVTSMGSTAFDYCSNLTAISVNAGNTVYSSEDGVVFNKDKTTLVLCPAGKTGSYTIPEGVTSIGIGAFQGCSGLTSVTIPEGVTSIGWGAFSGCSGLTSVYNRNPFPQNTSGVFGDAALANVHLYVPACALSAYQNADRWKDFGTITGDSELPCNPKIWNIGSPTATDVTATFTPDGTLTISGAGNMQSWNSPDVPWNDNRSNITSVVINNGVTSIERYAFFACSGLTSVTIPESVTSIGYRAFADCRGLTSVYNRNPFPQTIDGAFSVFSGVTLANIHLYVPACALSAYQNASVWKDFGTITGVEEFSCTVSVVTFDATGGSPTPAQQTVVQGEKATAPAAPTRTGYTFAGWYNGELLWNFNSPVTGNLALTAQWTENITGYEDELQITTNLYPNPFTGIIHLTGAEGSLLKVINTAGTVVHTQKVENPDETIHLEQLPAGLYLFRIEKDGKTKTIKAVKR